MVFCHFLNYLSQFQIQLWVDELPKYEYDICPNPTIVQVSFSIVSDAGESGFFVYRVESRSCLISRPLTQAESEENSTFCELTAVHGSWTAITILEEFKG